MSEGTGLIERFYKDIVESGNLALIDELAMDSYVDHEEALPGQPPGKDGVKYFVEMMRKAFPDIKVKEIEPKVVAGNMEACHVILTGTVSPGRVSGRWCGRRGGRVILGRQARVGPVTGSGRGG